MDHLSSISPLALLNLATQYPTSVRIMGIPITHTLDFVVFIDRLRAPRPLKT